MEFLSPSRRSSVEALLGGICAGLICLTPSASAQSVSAPGAGRLDPVVVTAKRQFDPVADEKMKEQVEEALHSDAFFYDAHVTVTIKNGVATLRGIVFDDWDLRQAMRISKRVAGVRRVVNELELELGGE
jgi:hypothetical protein